MGTVICTSGQSTVDIFSPVQFKQYGYIYNKLNLSCINDNDIETPGNKLSNILFVLSMIHPRLAFIHLKNFNVK